MAPWWAEDIQRYIKVDVCVCVSSANYAAISEWLPIKVSN